LRREQLGAAAKSSGAPELAVPRVIQVLEEIPLLGTGKTDYVQLKKMAEVAGGAAALGGTGALGSTGAPGGAAAPAAAITTAAATTPAAASASTAAGPAVAAGDINPADRPAAASTANRV
jgi:hypothetical protein